MLIEAAKEILEEMEENGWNQGEAEKFSQILTEAIQKNSERLRAEKPFTVHRIKKVIL